MDNQHIIEQKKQLIEVMQQENELLDKILNLQTILHNYVKEKNWENLQTPQEA